MNFFVDLGDVDCVLLVNLLSLSIVKGFLLRLDCHGGFVSFKWIFSVRILFLGQFIQINLYFLG